MVVDSCLKCSWRVDCVERLQDQVDLFWTPYILRNYPSATVYNWHYCVWAYDLDSRVLSPDMSLCSYIAYCYEFSRYASVFGLSCYGLCHCMLPQSVNELMCNLTPNVRNHPIKTEPAILWVQVLSSTSEMWYVVVVLTPCASFHVQYLEICVDVSSDAMALAHGWQFSPRFLGAATRSVVVVIWNLP